MPNILPIPATPPFGKALFALLDEMDAGAGDGLLPPLEKGDRGGFLPAAHTSSVEKSPLTPLFQRGGWSWGI
jgi:hypothetical protein